MFRITLAYFVRIGEELQAVRDIREGQTSDTFRYSIRKVSDTIDELINSEVLSHAIRASYRPARTLSDVLKRILERHPILDEKPQPIHWADVYDLSTAIEGFYSVFSAELEVANGYLVTSKGPYDTHKLIFRGETLFPDTLISKVPETVLDVQRAGTCLAFELATACGFHTLRAVESVLKRYWDHTSGGDPRPTNPNLGIYLKALGDKGYGDPLVIAAVKQIKDLHRNPLMHPEEHLTVDQAIGLVGMAQSAINAMIAPLPVLPDDDIKKIFEELGVEEPASSPA